MKKAQNIPIIRFKGFTMPWEKQKIKISLKKEMFNTLKMINFH